MSVSQNSGWSDSQGTSQGTSTNSGQSQNSSQSQSYVPDYEPQLGFLEQFGNMAGNLASNQYDWANDQFNNNSRLTDSNINNYLGAHDLANQSAMRDYQNYNDVFNPAMGSLSDDWQSYTSPERVASEMGRSEANVAQNFEGQRANTERSLRSYGINPSDPRYAGSVAANRTAQAAAEAGAGTQARLNTEATGRQLRSEALNEAHLLPGQQATEQNVGMQGVTGAQNAALGNTSLGALTLGTTPNYLNAGVANTKFQPLGNRSNSQGTSNNAGQSQNSGQNTGHSQNQGSSVSGGQGGPGGNKGGDQGGNKGGNTGGNKPGNNSGNNGNNTSGGPSWTHLDTQGNPDDWTNSDNYWNQDQNGNPLYDPSMWDYMGDQQNQDQQNVDQDQEMDTAKNNLPGDPADGYTQPWWDAGYSMQDYRDALYGSGDQGSDASTDGLAKGGAVPGGGYVPSRMSPSGGQQTDDIPAVINQTGGQARLNADEFVIPQDVVQWMGHKFFQELIEKSRKARMANPGPAHATSGPGGEQHVGGGLTGYGDYGRVPPGPGGSMSYGGLTMNAPGAPPQQQQQLSGIDDAGFAPSQNSGGAIGTIEMGSPGSTGGPNDPGTPGSTGGPNDPGTPGSTGGPNDPGTPGSTGGPNEPVGIMSKPQQPAPGSRADDTGFGPTPRQYGTPTMDRPTPEQYGRPTMDDFSRPQRVQQYNPGQPVRRGAPQRGIDDAGDRFTAPPTMRNYQAGNRNQGFQPRQNYFQRSQAPQRRMQPWQDVHRPPTQTATQSQTSTNTSGASGGVTKSAPAMARSGTQSFNMSDLNPAQLAYYNAGDPNWLRNSGGLGYTTGAGGRGSSLALRHGGAIPD